MGTDGVFFRSGETSERLGRAVFRSYGVGTESKRDANSGANRLRTFSIWFCSAEYDPKYIRPSMQIGAVLCGYRPQSFLAVPAKTDDPCSNRGT